MASRPLLAPQAVIIDGDLSTPLTSKVTIIQNVSMISYDISWTGTSPVGTLSVQVSNSYTQNADGSVRNAGTWTSLVLSVTPTVSGSAGSGFIDIDQLAGYAIRLIYTPVSGTGLLQATIAGKVA